MSLVIQCPNPACGKPAVLPEEEAGQVVFCPFCRTQFAAPAKAPTMTPTVGQTAHTLLPRALKEAASTSAPKPPVRNPNAAQIPEKIGRFQIRSLLGAGAAGTVYRAFDPHLEREVALKVPQASLVDSPRHIERFLREAKAAAQLRHPNIVPLFEAAREDGVYYIASAFIEGQTLADMIHQQKPDFRASARIIRDLAEALEYAHEQGIVHRDVKPANIMMDRKQRAHLMDFGLAHHQDFLKKLTHDGAVLGTPAYMAPEQAQGRTGDPLPASDQYSLGVIMYELLTGQLPFTEDRVEGLIFSVINKEPPPPRSIRRRIPLDLETICLKTLAKRPEDRYADCREMAKDLRRWLDGEPIRGRRADAYERAWQWVQREPALAATSFAVIFLLITVIVLMSARPPEPAPAPFQEKPITVAPPEVKPDAILEKKLMLALKKAAAVAEERDKALQERDDLMKAEESARQAATIALENLNKAREAEAAAKLREEAASATSEPSASRYALRLAMADMELATGSIARAQEFLADTSPAQRNWEWYYLSRRAGGEAFGVNTFGGFSADGSYFASMDSGQLEICDSTTGKVYLTGNTGSASPGGAKLAWSPSGFIAHQSILWDGKTGTQKQTLPKDHSSVTLSGDGKRLAVGLFGAITVYDTTTGAPVFNFQAPTKQVISLAFSPRADRLIAAAGNEAKVWDIGKGQELPVQAWTGHRFLKVVFSLDGKHAAGIAQGQSPTDLEANNHVIRVWEVASGAPTFTTPYSDKIHALALSPDGRTLASSGKGHIKLWDVPSGKLTTSMNMPEATIPSLSYRSDGKLLAYIQSTLYSPVPAEPLPPKGPKPPKGQKSSQPRPNKSTVVMEKQGRVITVQLAGTDSIKLDPGPEKARGTSIKRLTFSEDGRFVASQWNNNTIQVHRIADGSLIFNQKPPGDVYYFAISSRGRLVGTLAAPRAGEKGPDHLAVWDVQSGKPTFTLPDSLRDKGYDTLVFSPDEQQLAFSGGRGVGVVALGSGATMLSLGNPGKLLAFSSDGDKLASATFGGVEIWSMSERKKMADIPVVGMQRLAFSPPADRLATFAKGVLGTWDIKTAKQLTTDPTCYAWFPTPDAISRDGKRKLRIAGGYLHLLDAENDQLTYIIRAPASAINSAAFSPDGNRIATVAGTELRLWDGTPGR